MGTHAFTHHTHKRIHNISEPPAPPGDIGAAAAQHHHVMNEEGQGEIASPPSVCYVSTVFTISLMFRVIDPWCVGLASGLGARAQRPLLGQGLGAALAGLLQTQLQELVVLGGLSLGLGDLGSLERPNVTLPLDSLRGDQALDLGGAAALLPVLLPLAAVDVHVLAHPM